jgi:RNA polymerase sigma-70 factor (ECF subfamily)
MKDGAGATAERVARVSYGRLVAILSARDRDVAAAEDALSDAFAAALDTWPSTGVPENPEAWLLTTARRRRLDGWRRTRVREDAVPELALLSDLQVPAADGGHFPDRRLGLLFVCSHPAIDPAMRAPLMLQVVLGLDAARIASAFLVAPAALSQGLVRVKRKIRDAGIPFEWPPEARLAERVRDVLDAIYAAYGTGWEDVEGVDPRNTGLTGEAIELGRAVVEALPEAPEPLGLLALMLFCEARATARRDDAGDFVPLAAQDASRWDRGMIREAETLLARAGAAGELGPYQLEAAIQSVHAQRGLGVPVPPEALVILYDALTALHSGLGARVGRACAIAQASGAAAGLDALDALPEESVARYQPFWAARGQLLLDAGRRDEAVEAWGRAMDLATSPGVRRFLEGRLVEHGVDVARSAAR